MLLLATPCADLSDRESLPHAQQQCTEWELYGPSWWAWPSNFFLWQLQALLTLYSLFLLSSLFSFAPSFQTKATAKPYDMSLTSFFFSFMFIAHCLCSCVALDWVWFAAVPGKGFPYGRAVDLVNEFGNMVSSERKKRNWKERKRKEIEDKSKGKSGL